MKAIEFNADKDLKVIDLFYALSKKVTDLENFLVSVNNGETGYFGKYLNEFLTLYSNEYIKKYTIYDLSPAIFVNIELKN